MNWKQVAILGVIVVFGAYSLVPLYQYGLLGTFKLAYANSATTQVCLDLIIALFLIVLWMWRDAKHHEISAVPFVVITVLAGSFGPLLYLLKRSGLEGSAARTASSAG